MKLKTIGKRHAGIAKIRPNCPYWAKLAIGCCSVKPSPSYLPSAFQIREYCKNEDYIKCPFYSFAGREGRKRRYTSALSGMTQTNGSFTTEIYGVSTMVDDSQGGKMMKGGTNVKDNLTGR